jgi:hypothetical protein
MSLRIGNFMSGGLKESTEYKESGRIMRPDMPTKLIFLGEQDGEDAGGLPGIGGIFAAVP